MQAAEILAGGARLVRTQPKALAIWGVLYLAAIGATMALIWPMFADMAAFQQQALAAQTAHLPPPPPPGGFFLGIFGFDIVLLIVMVAIFAAAVRAVAQGGDDAFGFLRLGMDELRLLGLGVLLFIAAIVYFVVFAIVGGILIGAMFGGGASASGFALFAILGLAWLALGWWAEIRISLAGALTVLRGRIVIREAWRATRGRFWTLFGVYFLIAVAFLAVSVVVTLLANPDLFNQMALAAQQPGDPNAVIAQQQAMMANMFGPRWFVGVALGTVVNAVLLAFAFGAVATAAIGFSEADHAVG